MHPGVQYTYYLHAILDFDSSMASNAGPQTPGGAAKRTSFSGFPGTNASIFLEKAKAGIRGSTPDSEALASSDDEQDHHHRLHSVNQAHGTRQPRRPSWLTEVQQAPHRKGSLSGSGSFSPASSHPATPATDSINWNANVGPSPSNTLGRPPPNGVSFSWGNAIWTNDPQRGPPTRLTEVLPSPTSLVPPGSTSVYNSDAHMSPPLARDNPAEAAIPFAIPLQPTLKTYRSQSYSVGQLDPDSANAAPTGLGGYIINGRSRSGVPYGGLQHRPSRPSMLGDHDPTLLEQLQEVEDDDESSIGSEAGVKLSATQARTIEQLAMENALLRQAAADQLEKENSRGRSRAATTNSTSQNSKGNAQGYHQRIQESVPEETESALYDLDDADASQPYTYGGANGRRASEYGAKGGTQYFGSGILENRTLESVKKGHWQSSLGFGGLGEPPQSRRHSFADVPTRQTSLSSTTESQKSYAAAGTGLRPGGRHGSPSAYGEGPVRPSQGESGEYDQFRIRQRLREQQLELEHLRDRQIAVTYFSRNELVESHPTRPSPQTVASAYPSHASYGRSQHLGHSQPRPHQLLYIVTFKACRADVFYIQEGTGLQVKPGDLVIVEADRGTDLGTVAHDSIPWLKAKEMKEHYTEEHYRWLMVFSRHCQDGTPAGANPNGQTIARNSIRNGPTGPMGGPGPGVGGVDLPNADLKPKMIKRLAQPHEIQTLRDKEGNEAKAKRVCQQKVVEHRLNMEILDAEFQM